MSPLPQMVIKSVEGFEPEWDFAVLLIMISAPRNYGPANADIFAIGLKEYHYCYNAIECQFFI
jgi:hypothetical protein